MAGGVPEALFGRARNASARATAARDVARFRAVDTLRMLEARLISTVAGDGLRGLSDLGRPYGQLRAAATVWEAGAGIDSRIPRDCERVVLGRDGALLMAALNPDGRGGYRLDVHPVRDEELLIEDLPRVARAAQAALERHCEHSERTCTTWGRAATLSDRLARAVATAG